MNPSSDISTLIIELKRRYAKVILRNDQQMSGIANLTISAFYPLTCASLVVAHNAVSGKIGRKVMIDKKGVTAISVVINGNDMLEYVMSNLEQYVAITQAIKNQRTRIAMNKYTAELHNAIESATVRVYGLLKMKYQ